MSAPIRSRETSGMPQASPNCSGKIRIGVSGWRYTPWRGNFYPKGLAQSRELHYASRAFNSIELNGSFYSLQWPTSWPGSMKFVGSAKDLKPESLIEVSRTSFFLGMQTGPSARLIKS